MDHLKPSQFPGGMASLLEGVLSFRTREYGGHRDLMRRLAAAQQPQVMVIGCSDSRVDPALLCGARPGDLFTVRNVANLVPACEGGDGRGDGVRAALEYGVKVLGVAHVVVLGHARCGGIRALVEMAGGAPPALEFEFLGPWLGLAAAVLDQVRAELAAEGRPDVTAEDLQRCIPRVERRSILQSLDNLRTYPWIRDRVATGALAVHGWWFDLDDGRLWATSPETGAFLPVAA